MQESILSFRKEKLKYLAVTGIVFATCSQLAQEERVYKVATIKQMCGKIVTLGEPR